MSNNSTRTDTHRTKNSIDQSGGGANRDLEIVTLTLWGSWTHTATHATPGMELLMTEAERNDFGGNPGYSSTSGSFVVLNPSFIVDVTDIRNWVQCPRLYYLNKLSGVPLKYPVVKGTIVHEIFGDLLRDRDVATAVNDRVVEAGFELGLLDRSLDDVTDDIRPHAQAIKGWLEQGTITDEDSWRSECTLVSRTFGIKGRADALRRGMPVELKTGKNTTREPRFPDKIQTACYALLLYEKDASQSPTATIPDTGILLYTKNAAVDRHEESGDLSPAKDFSIGRGLLEYVVRTRNEIAALEHETTIPTGNEAAAKCEYCFERDTCMVVAGRLGQESKAGAIGRPVPEQERAYFSRMYRLIEAERREVHNEYEKLWSQSPIERANDDRALIDLEPIDKSMLDDGRWSLRARPYRGVVSKIRAGDHVLASDGDPIDGTAELARVERLDPSEVVVTTDEPIELRRIDVYPSEFGVDRMLRALHDAVLKGDSRRKAILFGDQEPRFGKKEQTVGDVNRAQQSAINLALNAEDYALIHGPPGTGKTHTIAHIVRMFVERGDRVLLSAFTNRAVDNAMEAIREHDDIRVRMSHGNQYRGESVTDVVRVGTSTGIREDMLDLHLESHGDPDERADQLRAAQIVAATATSCVSPIMETQSFDVAIIDEATQLTEPATLGAINAADRFVLVGDHHQLPPVIRSEGDLSRSLFERLIEAHPNASGLLDRQYRMAQRIQAFPSHEFYDGRLRPANDGIARQKLGDLNGVSSTSIPSEFHDPVSFVDVDGDDGRHTDDDEAAVIAQLVQQFVHAGVSPMDIGVIAPYRAQVAMIDYRVANEVTVDTVDRFQGSSKEVIFISFVASRSLDGPIFEDYRRLNVALTRARKAIVLVGTERALLTDPLYTRMVEWATKTNR